jgi:putative ABC transport system permease protein
VAATLAGIVAGGISGTLHTRLGVSAILAGVLTSTGLYSVSLFVMGSGNLSLASAPSLVNLAERAGHGLLGLPPSLTLFGDTVSGAAVATLVLALLLAGGLALALGLFSGPISARRCAAGNNPMARAVAIDMTRWWWARPLNGLIALRALFAKFRASRHRMGIGAVMTLASLMVGEALLGRARSPLDRRCGRGRDSPSCWWQPSGRAQPNALKLVTALLVQPCWCSLRCCAGRSGVQRA